MRIEPGTNLNTVWARSFVKIGEAWEAFAEEMGFKADGWLNPYGVSIDIRGALGDHPLHLRIWKVLQTIGNSVFNLHPAKYSTVTEVLVQDLRLPHELKVLIRKRRFVNYLFSLIFFPGKLRRTANFIIKSNPQSISPTYTDDELLLIPDFHLIRIEHQSFHLMITAIPDEATEIQNLFCTVKKLLEKVEHNHQSPITG